jgi:iron complex transport system permease protein
MGRRTPAGHDGVAAARLVALGIVALIVLAVASLLAGNSAVSLIDAWAVVVGNGSDVTRAIILGVRLPRLAAAVVCGSALACSGLLLQAALDNDLAAPGIMGINSGAGLAVLVAATTFPASIAAREVAAFVGALVSAATVYLISRRAGVSRTTLVLAGVAVGSLMGAGVDVLITFQPDLVADRVAFSIGGLRGISLPALTASALVVAVGLIFAATLAKGVDLFALGDETACGLGLDVRRFRLLTVGCASLLAAAAVSLAGLLSFIGLIVPNLVRMVLRGSFVQRLVVCSVWGACLMVLCDLVARHLFFPYELPVGLVMSAVGAPFFIWVLVRRHGRRASRGSAT